MLNPVLRLSTLLVILTLGTTLACGGGGGIKDSGDPGKLWVQPSPAFLTPGASLVFQAVPEVNSEAPYIRTATWSVLEPSGGSVQAIGNGEYATYTAPAVLGTFHLKAVSEYGEARYVPRPGTVQVVDPKGVSVSVSPSSFVVVKDYTGPAPRFTSAITPLTNTHVTWSVVEPGYEGPGLIQLVPQDLTRTCSLGWDNNASLDRLPGNLFHVRVQSAEAPTAYALVEVQVLR